MLTAVVGINWGDEGKGRMVDLLSENYHVICRYQGGNNAGHTVCNERGRFILNLLPSGILREGTVNVMGTGMVIDLEHFAGEVGRLRDAGIHVEPDNLLISDRATICMPYERIQDGLEEDRLAGKKFGSTRRGIGPVYGDKYLKKTLRMGDLFDEAGLEQKVRDLVEWKNLLFCGYGAEPIDADAMLAWLRRWGDFAKPFVCDTGAYLEATQAAGKDIMFEAQLGALRDIDYGIYPYTSSSSTIAAYAPIGAGIPSARLDGVVGIMKAYSSCVGEGPFTVEFSGDEAHALREAGGEYGAATGRPRRVGPFDVVASRYGVKLQGAQDCIALTKLDVLSYLESIPVCVAYQVDGVRRDDFPSGPALDRAKPVLEYLPGFGDISACRSWDELPQAARDYVEFLKRAVGCRIAYVSVGAQRDAIIVR
ncbi:MAG: adenylosuccinate synthase [Coriobacteriales bacterium]|nr:adenylosuccinate synthase [Coriobacteriales bacterium]